MGIKYNGLLERIPEFRKSIKDNQIVNQLPLGYGQIISINTGKYGLGGGDTVIIMHGNGGNPVFESISVAASVSISFPISGEVGRVWLTDEYGNLVIDPEVMIQEIKGWSLDWSVAAGLKVNKLRTGNGYILHVESISPEISAQLQASFTKFIDYQNYL